MPAIQPPEYLDEEAARLWAEHSETDIHTGSTYVDGCPTCYPEVDLAALDAMYHDHLPEGANCPKCGIEHAAINPSNLNNPNDDYLYEDQS